MTSIFHYTFLDTFYGVAHHVFVWHENGFERDASHFRMGAAAGEEKSRREPAYSTESSTQRAR